MQKKVKLYTLSTCGWCRKAKRFLDSHHIAYEFEDVDLLIGENRERARAELARLNPRQSYPTMVIDQDLVIVGFDEERLREALEL